MKKQYKDGIISDRVKLAQIRFTIGHYIYIFRCAKILAVVLPGIAQSCLYSYLSINLKVQTYNSS